MVLVIKSLNNSIMGEWDERDFIALQTSVFTGNASFRFQLADFQLDTSKASRLFSSEFTEYRLRTVESQIYYKRDKNPGYNPALIEKPKLMEMVFKHKQLNNFAVEATESLKELKKDIKSLFGIKK